MEREKFISVELSKCMEFWKQSIEQNATYKMKMIPYVEYWENILLHLSLFFLSSTLLEGFWPSSDWRSNYVKVLVSSTLKVVDLEVLIMCPYCGPLKLETCSNIHLI